MAIVVDKSNSSVETLIVDVPDETPLPSETASPSLAVEVNSEGEVAVFPAAATAAEEEDEDNHYHHNLEHITPASDLSARARRIWIVTTAALPWRTGTAVNPLLRALSLLTYPIPNYNSDDDQNENHHHVVTLMIPWLESTEARKLLYGTQSFANASEQEAWIRNYCITRCNATPEMTQRLQIQFWKGIYQESFGSIFPIEDICQQIPKDQADVCILEEPEHLNWFRNPFKQPKDDTKSNNSTEENKVEDEEKKIGEDPPEEVTPKNSHASPSRMSSTVSESSATGNSEDTNISKTDNESVEILGWAQKFRHVVGILHTNYGDYIRQYAFPGISTVTAPALNSLSSLVVKAYCHRVIRLSATLPHLDKTKEITSNVHGVRHEFFLDSSATNITAVSENETKDTEEKTAEDPVSDSLQVNEDEVKPTAVYFIGKLIWAKGFEKVLEVQEKFKIATGDYFEIDIYGSGKDEKDIQKAFFGKHGKPRMSKASSSVSEASDQSSATSSASKVFNSAESLRKQLCGADESAVDDENVVTVKTERFAASSGTATPTVQGSPQRAALSPGRISELLATPQGLEDVANAEVPSSSNTDSETIPNTGDGNTTTTTEDPSLFDPLAPLDVLGEVSEKTISTSIETADAAMSLIECVVKAGFGFSFENNKSRGGGEVEGEKTSSNKKMKENLPFHLAPAKSRFKVRQFAALGRLDAFFF
jgi:hypothetical protein